MNRPETHCSQGAQSLELDEAMKVPKTYRYGNQEEIPRVSRVVRSKLDNFAEKHPGQQASKGCPLVLPILAPTRSERCQATVNKPHVPYESPV